MGNKKQTKAQMEQRIAQLEGTISQVIVWMRNADSLLRTHTELFKRMQPTPPPSPLKLDDSNNIDDTK